MKVLIAGGGTGGHFFSGVAVGEAFLARSAANQVLYAGTRSGIEARVGPKSGLDVRFIDVEGIKGRGAVARLRAVLRLPLALWQSIQLIRKEKPHVVLGVGGYASGPLVLAGVLLRKTTAVMEQNSHAGITNRILGHFVDRVFVAFEPARRFFPRKKVLVTGNPIRERVVQLLTLESTATVATGERLRLLVLGGSQGAKPINDAMIDLVAALGESDRRRLYIVHQTGPQDEERVRAAYKQAGLDAQVHAFIEAVAEAYGAADLVLCRAGALTVSELCISRRPSVLVPFPQATDDHQTTNAKVLVDGGAAELLPQSTLSGASLKDVLLRLDAQRGRLQEMGRAAATLAHPEAAAEVVDELHRALGVP